MGILNKLAREFRKRHRAARQRALDKAAAERVNAELDLALDDQQFHRLSDRATFDLLQKRLGIGNRNSGYKSAIGEGFEFEDDGE